jgi:ribose transport system permease protein
VSEKGKGVVGDATLAHLPSAPAAFAIDHHLPLIILVLAAIAVAIAAILTPNFLAVDNITAILRNAAIVGLVAVAMTPITLSGNFVSLGISQSAMACMVAFVWLLGDGWPQPAAILVVITGSIVVGILQGVIVAGGLNPVITTLAAGAIIFGVASELTGGGIVRVRSNGASWGGKDLVGVPIEVLVFLIFTALLTLLMSRTIIGRETILVGANRATARISGISHARVTIVAFVILAIGVALAGIMSGAAYGEATAKSFPTLTINVIAALLVGGTAIQGGDGSPWRSAAGAVLISVISNMMVLNDFSPGGRLAVQGGVVVATVILLDLLRRRGRRSR